MFRWPVPDFEDEVILTILTGGTLSSSISGVSDMRLFRSIFRLLYKLDWFLREKKFWDSDPLLNVSHSAHSLTTL